MKKALVLFAAVVLAAILATPIGGGADAHPTPAKHTWCC